MADAVYKCIVIGDEACGKSSFIERLLEQPFTNVYYPTTRILNERVHFRTKSGTILALRRNTMVPLFV